MWASASLGVHKSARVWVHDETLKDKGKPLPPIQLIATQTLKTASRKLSRQHHANSQDSSEHIQWEGGLSYVTLHINWVATVPVGGWEGLECRRWEGLE